MASGKTSKRSAPSTTKARRNVLANQKAIDAATRKVWSVARHAPVFCKSGKSGGSVGKLRANPLISKHAMQIALAGAAMRVQKELREEAAALRVKTIAESKESPFQPQLSEGAAVLIEQHIAGFVQEGVRNAGIMRQASDRKKISFEQTMRGMKLAYDRAKGADKTLVVLDAPRKRVSRFDKLKREAAAKKSAETRAKNKAGATAAPAQDDGEEM